MSWETKDFGPPQRYRKKFCDDRMSLLKRYFNQKVKHKGAAKLVVSIPLETGDDDSVVSELLLISNTW